MDPVTLSLIGASVGGGLLQSFGGRKQRINPAWLKKHFGAEAVNEEMVKLYNHVLASPYGQQMMASAATQGSMFENDLARRTAASGFGPAGGAESGASIFSQAAAGGATNALQRQGKGDIMQLAIPIAQQLVSDRMNAAMQGEMQYASQPSGLQMFGGMLSRGANAGLAAGAGQSTPRGTGTTKRLSKTGTMVGSRPMGGGIQVPIGEGMAGGEHGPYGMLGLRGQVPAIGGQISGTVPVPSLRHSGGRGFFSRLSRFGSGLGRLVMPGA